MQIAPAVAFGIGISCLTACSAYRDPAVSMLSAQVHERTDEAISIQFTLDLQNPNDQPLELIQFKYDVHIDGRKVYSGVRAAQATLAANGSRQMSIPAVLRFDRTSWTDHAPPANASYELSGTLQYATPGEIAQILLDTGVRKPKAGFRNQGNIAF